MKIRGGMMYKYDKCKEFEKTCKWLKSFGRDLSKIKIKCEVTDASIKQGIAEKE